jgi:prepilin-type processing-associated H-X9-DG protein
VTRDVLTVGSLGPIRRASENASRVVNEHPASYHNRAGGLSFADGHSEIRKWRDPRTIVPDRAKTVPMVSMANNQDVVWLWEHTTRFVK